MRNYAVLIMTHGRAGKIFTDDTLRKSGYTGRIIYVIDTDDEQGDKYRQIYGEDNVVSFDKNVYEQSMDTGDNGGSMKCVVFARNACFDIAKELGLDYFIEADDDYTSFAYRYEEDQELKQTSIKNLNGVFDLTFDFLDESGAIAVAPAQCGDYIGGKEGGYGEIDYGENA